jgi:hypothetical protein
MRSLLVATLLALPMVPGAPRAEDTKAFFNGKNLDGWEGLIDKFWRVEDGAIVGETKEDPKHNTFLCSKKKYKDFELSFKIRLKNGVGNSGVQIRSEIADPKKFTVKGPQADIGQGYWGSLYGENFGGMMKACPKDFVKNHVKEKEFNDYYIKCVGKHVTIKINGETSVDDDFPKMPDEGIIAWQLHAGFPAMEVTFKDIKFTEIVKGKGDKKDSVSIQGKVTLDGKPLASATIGFHPEAGKGKAVTGLTNEQGAFVLGGKSSDDLAPGKYKVTVAVKSPLPGKTAKDSKEIDPGIEGKRPAPVKKIVLNPKYASPKTTPMEVDLTVGDNKLSLDLSSK